jgi:hypothetical protein
VNLDSVVLFFNSFSYGEETTWTNATVEKLVDPLKKHLQERNWGKANDSPILEIKKDPLLALEKQYNLLCWKHVLTSVLGITFPAEIALSNWYTGLSVCFIHFDNGYLDQLDPMELDAEHISFCDSKICNQLTSRNIQDSMATFLGLLKSNSITHANKGMTQVDMHKFCCNFNTAFNKKYLGCIQVGTNSIRNFAELKFQLVQKESNVAFAFASISAQQTGKHYYAIWIGKGNVAAVFDPIHGITRFMDDDEDSLKLINKTAIFESKWRTFFLLNLNLNESGQIDTMEAEHLAKAINGRTDHILSDILKLPNFGFERNRSFGFALSSVPLQLSEDGGDEDAVFGNPLVIVKLSNVYNENTGMYTSL